MGSSFLSEEEKSSAEAMIAELLDDWTPVCGFTYGQTKKLLHEVRVLRLAVVLACDFDSGSDPVSVIELAESDIQMAAELSKLKVEGRA